MATESISLDESISIGVSAYGNHETTKHCLRAILDGFSGDYELILVDDCSPDGGLISDLFLRLLKSIKIQKFTGSTKIWNTAEA